MNWRPWMSWYVVLPVWAGIAYLSTENWVARLIAFAIIAVPLMLWVRFHSRTDA